jgi:hypothetical protein
MGSDRPPRTARSSLLPGRIIEGLYPLKAVDHRRLPQDYVGNVYVWDVDKTYLATRFSSVRQLARIALEFAIDKRAIVGMPQVLHGLRRGPGPSLGSEPLYFVTASPPQMRKVIERRMLLDGVDHDGITFKDWGRVIRSLHPRRLREQIGFKICALLVGRCMHPMATEYLFGDDVESDAEAYSMYARMISGEVSAGQADSALSGVGVADFDRAAIVATLRNLPTRVGRVQKIFIHLEKGTAPQKFGRYGPQLLAVRGAIQLSLALRELGLVDDRTVREAIAAATEGKGAVHGSLQELLSDGVARGLVSAQTVQQLGL